ncbi:hypothetical protein E4U54_007971 [Claviceps lovelessii]|nr:hypothetical protein E4U54_007971 [Claviceps lovelessii]
MAAGTPRNLALQQSHAIVSSRAGWNDAMDSSIPPQRHYVPVAWCQHVPVSHIPHQIVSNASPPLEL